MGLQMAALPAAIYVGFITLLLLTWNFDLADASRTILIALIILSPNPSLARTAYCAEFPMMAAIFMDNGKSAPCGGVIVGRAAVVSAAHCFLQKDLKATAKTASLLVGDVNLFGTRTSSTRQKVQIKRIMLHPGYKQGRFDHDVAIIEALTRFQFSDNVRPAIVIDHKPKSGDQCNVAGYGRNYNKTGITVQLQSKPVKIVEPKVCQSRLTGYNDRFMICGGDTNAQDKSCKGDSGGPLICGEEFAGIVTYGMRCVTENAAGAFIDIRQYEKWIKGNLPRSRLLEEHPKYKATGNRKFCVKGWLYPAFIFHYLWIAG